MIPITFFRSSSFSAWDFCEQSFYLVYRLGMQSPTGKKALLGTCVHKALECLAWAKKCKQDGTDRFDDDAFGTVFVVDCDPGNLAERAFDFYSTQESHLEFFPRDKKSVRDWTWKALTMQNGRFDPRKRDIVVPEVHFDFEFPQNWASYSFPTEDGVIEGQLKLKGTIDLTTRLAPNIFEVVDWKTGKALNWGDGSVKDFAKLSKDPQLMIYHYAISKLFPEAETVLMTIVFMNDTGSTTIAFHKSDLDKTEDMIRRRFEKIKNTSRPRLNKGWKCKAFCHFGKNNYPGTDKTICEHIKDELISKGDKQVAKEYTREGFKLGYYAAPGAVAE